MRYVTRNAQEHRCNVGTPPYTKSRVRMRRCEVNGQGFPSIFLSFNKANYQWSKHRLHSLTWQRHERFLNWVSSTLVFFWFCTFGSGLLSCLQTRIFSWSDYQHEQSDFRLRASYISRAQSEHYRIYKYVKGKQNKQTKKEDKCRHQFSLSLSITLLLTGTTTSPFYERK